MQFRAALTVALLAVGALAAPVEKAHKRAGLLAQRAYADFQVSDGVAGNALAEVNAKFPIDQKNLANVDPGDVKILSAARTTADDAETQAFNSAVSAASGDAATALQNGKTKNKVLMLQLEVLGLQIKQAQSDNSVASQITEEQTKLTTNINLDKKAAGQASQSVQFTGT